MQTENVEVPVVAAAKRVYKPLSAEAKAAAAAKRAATIATKKANGVPGSKWSAEAKARAAEKRAQKPKPAGTLTPEAKTATTKQALDAAVAALARASDDAERIKLALAVAKAVAANKRAQTAADKAAGTYVAPPRKRNLSFLEASGLPGVAALRPHVAPRNLELEFDQVAPNQQPLVEEPEEEEPEEELAEPAAKVVKKPRKQMTPEAKAAAAKKRADTIAAKNASK
jgi:hypothetical protein